MTKSRKRRWMFAVFASLLGLSAAAPWLIAECNVCEAATTILLSGTVVGKCTVAVAGTSQAVELAIDTPGTQRVLVGTALQNCNGRRSYTLAISSMNCMTAPIGGKVLDPVSGAHLRYTGEFANPSTGGSQASVTRLLESSCTGQIGRTVTSGNITNETSQIFLNFTGSSDLGAGTYQDTVTISLNMQ